MASLLTIYGSFLLALLSLPSSAQNGGFVDECDGKGIRPVILIGGFQASNLYDSSNGFALEWRDPKDFDADGGGGGDLKLPVEWDSQLLEQAQTPIGVEESPDDTLPDLIDANGTFYVEVCSCIFMRQRAGQHARYRPRSRAVPHRW
jgi:hypothetical protein